ASQNGRQYTLPAPCYATIIIAEPVYASGIWRKVGGIELNDQNVAGLSVILGQMEVYFRNRVNVDDLDVLNFSLYHLFCRIDYLYLTALPELFSSSILAVTEQALSDDLAYRRN